MDKLFLVLPMLAFDLFLLRWGLALAYSYVVVAASVAVYFCVTRPAYWFVLSVLLLFTVLIILYSRFIEPYWLHVKHTTIPVDLKRPLKIALLTDIHVSKYKHADWVARIVREVIAAKPDLVVITGDMVNNQFPKEDEMRYLVPLAKLKQFPVYYVLGNHDYGSGRPYHFCFEDRSEEVKSTMHKLGIPLLQNSLAEVTLAGQKLTLFGSDDLWSRPVHYKALKDWNQKTPLLFLVHNPDTVITWPGEYPPPIMTLGGHSHGGQFALFGYPLGSATMDLGRQCYRSLHEHRGIPFYVSVGLGESTIPFRFGVRPELSIITLETKKLP